MRGIAIALVLLHHFNIAYPLGGGWLVHAVARNGNYGVTMFFAISGFLITSTAIGRWQALERVSVLGFYRMRAARIGPTLLLFLVAVNGLALAGVGIFVDRAEAGLPVPMILADAAALTFTMNVLMGHAGWFNYALCVLWSLSVEEVFYLFFPLLSVTFRGGRLLAFLGVIILTGPIWRWLHRDDEYGLLYAYFACFDGIAIGCAARLVAFRPSAALLWAAGGSMLILYLSGPIWATAPLGVSAMAAGTAILMLGASATTRAPGWMHPPAWLGRHSYELYLGHLVPLGLLRTVWPNGAQPEAARLALLAGYLLSAGVIAMAVGRFVAEPLNRRLRGRLLRGATQPRPAT